jgi:hypothetical protein
MADWAGVPMADWAGYTGVRAPVIQTLATLIFFLLANKI